MEFLVGKDFGTYSFMTGQDATESLIFHLISLRFGFPLNSSTESPAECPQGLGKPTAQYRRAIAGSKSPRATGIVSNRNVQESDKMKSGHHKKKRDIIAAAQN